MTSSRAFVLSLTSVLPLFLAACEAGPLLWDRDGGPHRDAAEPDAARPDAGPPPFDAGPACRDDDPTAPADPTRGAWEDRFGVPGVGGSLANVSEIAFGPSGEVYVAGTFDAAGYAPARNVAVWTATEGWRAMGEGLPGQVRALVADGGVVWAAWSPDDDWERTRLARWDGSTWSEVAISEGAITDLAIVSGTLFAVGYFTRIGEDDVRHLARFDGTTWSGWPELAPDGDLEAMSVRALDDLCVGGRFTTLGVIEANAVACWDGTRWTARSMPLPLSFSIDRLVRDRDGTLIAAGNFALEVHPTEIGMLADEGGIARWVGDRWELIGGGISGAPGGPGWARGVAIVETGLYVGGSFAWAGGYRTLSTPSVARWDGARWHDLGGLWKDVGVSNEENVWQVAAGPDGSVYFGGLFVRADGTRTSHVARWDGAYWSALRTPGERAEGVAGAVHALEHVGSCALYVGGQFEYAGAVRADNVARYTPEGGFEPLGSGVVGPVLALEASADGARVFAGGSFLDAETGVAFANLAVWDGARWSGVGGSTDGTVRALVHVAGEGTDDRDLLYVGGAFGAVGGDTPASGLAVWDGARWRVIPGLEGWPIPGAEDGERFPVDVYALLLAPETGDLIVGGSFARAGAVDAANVARWDGSAWHALGAGFGHDATTQVASLAWWQGRVVAGGTMRASGDTEIDAIAVWDGTRWQSVGRGLSSPSAPDHFAREVSDLMVLGPHLYAAGSFSVAAGTPYDNVAVFDGTSWRAVGGGPSDSARTLDVLAGGLYVGGGFARTGRGPSVGLARFAFDEARGAANDF